ncbi:MAG TPA: hypothetical protein VM870_08440, partial [Pyrinomonadaceae bacterium]|nr:hypothetical protein [Pyrinomonadaceae bacterium]
MSVKLTTNLSQRLVLTPQLRQRIEMLQMTTVELSELIQQQMTENPVLEEVVAQDETREVSAELLDHAAGSADLADNFDRHSPDSSPEGELNGFSTNGDAAAIIAAEPHASSAEPETHFDAPEEGGAETEDRPRDAFEEIDFGREFQEYLDPGYRT